MGALERNPSNTDLLQSTKFRVTFDRLPGVTFFCQTANLPGVSLTEVPVGTPFVDLYYPGEKIVYDTFNVTFLVDEDLRAWTELHDWIRAITFPTSFNDYKDLAKLSKSGMLAAANANKPTPYSMGILSIYTNKNNPNFRVKMYDMFPTQLGSLIFNVSDTAENIVTCDATFRFSYFNYERI
jgi:hypothetical protein